MASAAASVGTFALPLVLATALLQAPAGYQHPGIQAAAFTLLIFGVALLANWLFGLWVFYLSRTRAPRRQPASVTPCVSLEWSVPNEFPEDFAPLIALSRLVATGEGVTGALMEHFMARADLELQPGRHVLRLSSRDKLWVVVDKQARKCRLVAGAGRTSEEQESSASHLSLELPHVQLCGIAAALEGFWELWDSGRHSWIQDFARCICMMAIRLLEAILPIRLSEVEGTCAGEHFLFFFTGSVGPIPFIRLHLPPFVVPRLHAPLSRLLSKHPVPGQRLRKGRRPPVLHPSALVAWSAEVEAVVSPVGVQGTLHLRDGSCSSFTVSFLDQGRPLHMQCEVSGSLTAEHMTTQCKSFKVSGEEPGTGARCIQGSATVSLARHFDALASSSSLQDILFDAACKGSLDTSLDVHVSTELDKGSQLPQPLRLTFSDEHPLMLGRVTIAAVIESAAMWGQFGLRQELPMKRKRDLLVLPRVDLHFELAIFLEENASAVDDGFGTVRFQNARGKASGRIFSDAVDCLDCLRADAVVLLEGRVAAEVHDPTVVQALLMAEAFGRRLGAVITGSSSAEGRAGAAATALELHSEGGNDELQDEGKFSVHADDVIQIEVGGHAHGQLLGLLRSVHPAPPPRERVSTSSEGGSSALGGLVRARSFDEAANLDPAAPSLLRISIAGSVTDLELGEFRASVGDLTLSVPPIARLHLDVHEAEINAEGIGLTHLHASWEGLGQPVVQHRAKQLRAVLPPLPSTGGAAARLGSMGQTSLSYDGEVNLVDLGNRLLDDEDMYRPALALAAMLDLEPLAAKLLNFARVVRNVLRSEGISGLKDIIPADRLACFLARVMLEIGTDGQHSADGSHRPLEAELLRLVRRVVDGKGLDVGRTTRLLWDFLPAEACAFVQHYTAEVDFAMKWIDSMLQPTEPASRPGPSMATEPPPTNKFRRDLQEIAPCAGRLYEAASQPGALPRQLEASLLKASPYLTTEQVEYLLGCRQLTPDLQQRLRFLLGLKRRVEKVAEGYGGLSFMPQGMAVGFFLATAIRGSFVGSEPAASLPRELGVGSPSAAAKLQPRAPSAAGERLAALLREQRAISAEMARLQQHQQQLVEEAAQLVGLDGPPPSALQPADQPMGRVVSRKDSPLGQADASGACTESLSMLDFLAPDGGSCTDAKAAVRANATLAAQHEQQRQRAVAQQRRGSGPGWLAGQPHRTAAFDLGCSLLGPAEVAVLLQSGLAAMPQGRQVQQNQRMLLELMVSQPSLFLKGVLYELSNNGSSRVLSNHLLALLDLKQNAVRPSARLDVADLLTVGLGVQMPRRADFMAGGSHASSSYLLFVNRAAKQVLEECEPYVALKHWLQRAEVPLPQSLGELGPELVPAAQRAVERATWAIGEADAAGDAWLKERGPVWREGVLGGAAGALEPPGELNRLALRERATELYRLAFAQCTAALKAHPEVLRASWFHDFMLRNYDALIVVSVLRNVQQNVDRTRHWVDAQLRYANKCSSYQGPSTACEALWSMEPSCEACLVDCLLEILYYEPGDREKYRRDSLMQLAIDEPPGHFNFTVISAMGVITEGAAGTEMAATYERLEATRGVRVVRADTATLQSVDYNAACIERAVRESVRTPWGWVGYSQGVANAFRAESMMLQGTPRQQRIVDKLRCRQLLFSAANGSAHATCGDLKLLRALVDGERFIKRFQASLSGSTQQLALELLDMLLSSRVACAVLGSMQSLTHEGARRMWRDGQHCHWVPTTTMRGVVEAHSLPESLQLLASVLAQQMDYSKSHDTQVAVEEAVGHPISVRNTNARLLAQVDLQGAVQRSHHWSPLHDEVAFIATKRDEPMAVYDLPKDRHIFPWLEVSARFGIIERIPAATA